MKTLAEYYSFHTGEAVDDATTKRHTHANKDDIDQYSHSEAQTKHNEVDQLKIDVSNNKSTIEGISASLQNITIEQSTQNQRLNELETIQTNAIWIKEPEIILYNGSNTFTLLHSIEFLVTVEVSDSTENMVRMQTADLSYVKGQNTVTINNHTFASDERARFIYASKEA